MTGGGLKLFTVRPEGDGFRLRIEAEDGRSLDIGATRRQVDAMADALDHVLAVDDVSDGADAPDDDDGAPPAAA